MHLPICLVMLIAVFMLYLSSRNQQIIQHRLTSSWRWLAFLLLALCLIGWLQLFGTTTAIFVWMALLMLFGGSIPFLSLYFAENTGKRRHGKNT